jgi:hypothetical protein
MAEVQAGLKSKAFRALRTNPVQEQVVSNFHRALHKFIENERERDRRQAPAAVSPVAHRS